jgi:ABC-type transport system substrate-binding protein
MTRLLVLVALVCAAVLVAAVAVEDQGAGISRAHAGDALPTAFSFVGFTVDTPPLEERDVRAALAHAIDRTALLSLLPDSYAAGRAPADRLLPPGSFGYDAPLQGLGYNPLLADTLLAGSAHPTPDLGISFPTLDLPPYPLTAAILSGTWEDQLSVDVTPDIFDYAAFVNELASGAIEGAFVLLDVEVDYADPQQFFDGYFRTDGAFNYMRYSNPGVDALLNEADVETDPEVRAGLFSQAEAIIVQDAVVLPLWWYPSGPASATPTAPVGTPTPVATPTPAPSFDCGDVNKSGEVNAVDAALILQYAAQLTHASNATTSDVNGDGAVNAIDAALVLQQTAGLIGLEDLECE